MTISINGKRTPPHQKTFNRPLTPAGLLAVFTTAALWLTSCPSPAGTTTYTTTVIGTVTASEPGESAGIDLPDTRISALTTPANPANQPTTTGPDGNFTLQVKHSGSFRLKVENTCSEPFKTDAVTTEANGFHNAGTLLLTLGPKPVGTARYSITEKSSGGYKLTLKCVREIGKDEFSADGPTITKEAAAKRVADPRKMITEIALPSTLRSIGKSGLEGHTLMSGTLTIPRNVKTLAEQAFEAMALNSTAPLAVVFEPGSKLESIGASAFYDAHLEDFTLPENLETIGSLAFHSTTFSFSGGSPGTLIIPSKVFKIDSNAFQLSKGITTLDIRSDQLRKPDAPPPFPLRDDLIKEASITEIKLPLKVYESYTEGTSEYLKKIFGDKTKYLKPNGTAY